MSRLIDADELKKCVLKWLPQDPCGKEEKEFPFETDICVSMLMEIDEQPTITPESHWIPVTERLPYAEYGESDNVFATCGYRDVEDGSIRWIKTLYFNGGNWCYPTGETYLEKVYAWMPLPDPYKGVTE